MPSVRLRARTAGSASGIAGSSAGARQRRHSYSELEGVDISKLQVPDLPLRPLKAAEAPDETHAAMGGSWRASVFAGKLLNALKKVRPLLLSRTNPVLT